MLNLTTEEREEYPILRSVRKDSLAVSQSYPRSESLIRLIAECFTWVKLYFSHRKERWEHLLPLIALTYLTFPDTERWEPPLKPLRYVSHNTLTQIHSSDSHWGHSQNVLPWWADGNQRKSISNDRLLLSTQLILLVIAVDLIEWLHTHYRHSDTETSVCARTHPPPSTLNPITFLWIRSVDLPHTLSAVILLRQAAIWETIHSAVRGEPVYLINPLLIVQVGLDCGNIFTGAEDVE